MHSYKIIFHIWGKVCIYHNMKVFGFKVNNEKVFIHVVCNVIIFLTIASVVALSFFSPTVSVAYMKNDLAIYSGNSNKNNVSLMINVYWGTEYIDQMLEIFKEKNVKVTFFVGGTWVAKNNEKLAKICTYGHEIGSHGYHHKDHSKLSYEQNKDEIYMTHELVKSLTGLEMNLFAPPSGSYNDTTLNVANNLGYKTILWSKDTIDWRDKNATLIEQRATNNVTNGDLILMHPTAETVKALPMIIDALQSKGYILTTVTENLT